MRKIENISVFDMLKIGIGPSSSHTFGPWVAALKWLEMLINQGKLAQINWVRVDLYGSLSLTGKGHATDIAVQLGLEGYDPQTFPVEKIEEIIHRIKTAEKLYLNGRIPLPFHPDRDIVFNHSFKKFHPNGITFTAGLTDGSASAETFYSIGGGFVVQKERRRAKKQIEKFRQFPFPVQTGAELLHYCNEEQKKVSEIVLDNELTLRSTDQIDQELSNIWRVMVESIYLGCHTEGTLPGGLQVRRRAYDIHLALIGGASYVSIDEWMAVIGNQPATFRQTLRWVSCWALAVNEVNASFGRVVTAPTNGSAGVIPAVMLYYLIFENRSAGFKAIRQFMLVAGEIGSLFKKGATISAAMGGCQAEIGVSSSMAAGALTELMGGSPAQVMMASEIAMEHHLGLTCDPIAGLVQIPCIERNAMGAVKAINAAQMALDTDAAKARVPLDKVIETMWQTARDMNKKYKETSEGGLAVNVALSDC